MYKGMILSSILTIVMFLSSFVYGESTVIGKITNGNGTTNITKNIMDIKTDPANPGSVVVGLQGDLTQSSTIYFYGYLDSYSIVSIGNSSSFSIDFMSGYKAIPDGVGFGDNFKIAISSPSIFVVNVGTGATVGYTIKGIVYK